jgi:hypothetical protein
MLIVFIMLIVIIASVYTFSYGIFLAKKERNTLAAFGVILLVVITLTAPVLMLILKY